MRLVFKIMVGVMAVIAVLLAIHSYLVVQREITQFREDMDLHAYLLGTVLVSSVSDVWQSVGQERAMHIIADANRSENLVRVRLVWFDQEKPDSSGPLVPEEELASLKDGKELLFPEYTADGVDYHIAYFPVKLEKGRATALELSQPLDRMYRYTRITILQKVALFLAFLVVGGGLVWWLGIKMVGRPIKALAAQAQGVGHGDLISTNDYEGLWDEIGQLARGFNQMVRDLRAARDRLEHETAQRLSAVEQLNHAERLTTVGKLASGLAHELGTPLNVVSGRAKMIAAGEMTQEEVQESAGVIRQQAERMAGLIRKLLDFARKSPGEMRRQNVAHLAQQATHMLSPLAGERSVKLADESDGSNATVSANPSQIQQVLSNLIMNAVHAMPDGGTVTVRSGVRQIQPPADHGGKETDYAFIDVIDQGIGIKEENLSHIFDPFFSTKQVGDGTGLGLSIAHGIIKEHGGWVTVASTIGEGSTFTVFLPLEGDK